MTTWLINWVRMCWRESIAISYDPRKRHNVTVWTLVCFACGLVSDAIWYVQHAMCERRGHTYRVATITPECTVHKCARCGMNRLVFRLWDKGNE